MKQAMIFAAGLGTRLKPLTDTMPKALVKVGGEPLLKHVVLRLKNAGFTRIVVNVHHFAGQIINYLQENNNFGLDIYISDEREGLLETGGGIKKALPLFDQNSPILIHNVDILNNVDLSHFVGSQPTAQPVDALLLVSPRPTKRYLLFEESMQLCGWTNVETGEVRSPYDSLRNTNSLSLFPHLEKLAFSGIHVLFPSVYHCFEEMPQRFSIIDFYLKFCNKYSFLGCNKKDLRLVDVGKLDSIEQADHFLRVEDT